MQLLYVCSADTGGIAEYAIRQVRALADCGVEVTVLCKETFPVDRLNCKVLKCRKIEIPTFFKTRKGVFGKIARVAGMITDSTSQAREVARIMRDGEWRMENSEEKAETGNLTTGAEGCAGKTAKGSPKGDMSGSEGIKAENQPTAHCQLPTANSSCPRPVILFACYAEYFSPFWAPVLRRLAKGGVIIGTIAHDPVRDFVVGPRWWHRWSVRQGYSFIRHVFVHDDTPVDFSGQKPERISVHQIPHGPYEISKPSLGRTSMRSDFGFIESDVVFLSFGHIRDGKNLDRFIRTMCRLPAHVKLLVAGSGGVSSQKPPEFYQNLASELGVADRCRWEIGHIPEGRVGDLFAAADRILLTYSSAFRSASGVLNTAVMAQKPVLASSGSGPLKNLVRKFNLGIWVEPDDDEAIFAGAMQSLSDSLVADWSGYFSKNSWEANAKGVVRAFARGPV
jgi:glycosyltransferase involved in cell wall biosynthesis